MGISLNYDSLTLNGLPTSVDQQNAIATAVTAAQNYINNLLIGEELVINQLADAILSSSSTIADIGNPDSPINSIFIWRSREDGTRYSRTLISNYIPALGERIVVENLAGAITLTIAP